MQKNTETTRTMYMFFETQPTYNSYNKATLIRQQLPSRTVRDIRKMANPSFGKPSDSKHGNNSRTVGVRTNTIFFRYHQNGPRGPLKPVFWKMYRFNTEKHSEVILPANSNASALFRARKQERKQIRRHRTCLVHDRKVKNISRVQKMYHRPFHVRVHTSAFL